MMIFGFDNNLPNSLTKDNSISQMWNLYKLNGNLITNERKKDAFFDKQYQCQIPDGLCVDSICNRELRYKRKQNRIDII